MITGCVKYHEMLMIQESISVKWLGLFLFSFVFLNGWK